MKLLAVTAALAAICTPHSTQAAEISPAAMQAAVRYALPQLVSGIRTSCGSQLSPTGFLARNGDGLEQRYAQGADTAWPAARAALIQMGDKDKSGMAAMFNKMPDSALKPFVDATISSMIATKLKPAQCPDIERGIELLAPLPPENVAGLVGFIVEMKEREDQGKARNGG